MKSKAYTINTLDLNFQGIPRMIAAYLVEGPTGNALIETGPGSTLPELLSALEKRGLSPTDIDAVLVTHIHFDHAGAAGWWAQEGIPVYVHHFGARHLIHPEKLIASASRIYGELMDSLWGAILPAPEDKIIPVMDSDTIEAAGLTFTARETPGHARHHHVYELDDIAFTGDAAGIRLPHTGLADIPTPPPEFDREQWQDTLAFLMGRNYRSIYPTHFGECPDVARQLKTAEQLLGLFTSFIEKEMADLDRDKLVTRFTEWNHERGREMGLSAAVLQEHDLVNPPYMTVDGILRYWHKRQR